MKAKYDFKSSITEIQNLTSKIDGSKNDNTLFKSIVLLLCAKLEKYVKDSVFEYVKNLSDLKLKAKYFPQAFLDCVIQNEIDFAYDKKAARYIEKHSKRAKTFCAVFDKETILDNINAEELVISISNNNSIRIQNIYSKIGFEDLTGTIKDYKQENSYGGAETITSFPILDTINKVISIRHEIIHEDATPPLTTSVVQLYTEIFIEFVNQIDNLLAASINTISAHNV